MKYYIISHVPKHIDVYEEPHFTPDEWSSLYEASGIQEAIWIQEAYKNRFPQYSFHIELHSMEKVEISYCLGIFSFYVQKKLLFQCGLWFTAIEFIRTNYYYLNFVYNPEMIDEEEFNSLITQSKPK